MEGRLVKLRTQSPQYGQLVIGPPGAGKTSYCHRMQQFLEKIGRGVAVVNLDPANENMQYKSAVDIMRLITVQDAMRQFSLGPNGALLYCMEFLETNFQWLLDQLKSVDCKYFLFDCPGQVELFTHNNALKNVFAKLEQLGYHLCTVHLVESQYCAEPHKFISCLLLSLHTMLQMGLPHVNVLSKADQLKKCEARLPFSVEYYTEVLDLNYLLECMDNSTMSKQFTKLNAAIVSMVEDYSLVSFLLLDSNREGSLLRLKNAIDKANGYVYGAGEEKNVNTLLACAVGAETETERMERDLDPYLS
ncbi:ATP-binding domain 1 family member B [Anopheles darlingi]|uniref:GPN-loop GTPase 2 n=1 Tax=Anopheles darlingi TaxID=43151 RepID=W5JHH9_ANODA|nr:GPN-loop GTPase 2 [Anopheles darlingi]ETN62365.1 ATP-binding domain 1 family member B [Anopheles darlingi]